MFQPGQTASNYRVADLVVSRPENRTRHGVEARAELVVELLSPDDETHHKQGFYAEMEVQEAHLDRRQHRHRRRLIGP